MISNLFLNNKNKLLFKVIIEKSNNTFTFNYKKNQNKNKIILCLRTLTDDTKKVSHKKRISS